MCPLSPHPWVQLLGMMEEARRAGLNALRVLAFKDGHTLPHAMQVSHS